MTTCGAQGALSKVLVEPGASPHVFDSSSETYPFLYETMGTERKYTGTRAIYGTRSQWGDRIALSPYLPRGVLALQPGPADLDLWLPRILGGTKVGNNIDPAETLPSFGVLIDRDGFVFEYKDCVVARAVFRGRSGPTDDESEIVEMVLEIIGQDELRPTDSVPPAWPITPPTMPTGTTRIPYIFSQGTLTLGGNSRSFDDFVLTIDNQVVPRWRNSITPTCLLPMGRVVSLQTTNPFITGTSSDMDLLHDTGATGSLVFTSGTVSCTFSFTNLRNIYRTPNVRGKTEIPVNLNLRAFRDQATAYEIRVTNDSTV